MVPLGGVARRPLGRGTQCDDSNVSRTGRVRSVTSNLLYTASAFTATMRGTVVQAWLLLASVLPCAGFYLPGVAPIEYEKGHKVDLKVNKLTSTKTQLPYEWCGTPSQPHPSKLR